MIIDVNKLKQQGKTEGDFTLEYIPERQLLDLPNAEIVGGVRVEVTVRIAGRDATVEGEVSFTVKGDCSRCLEEAVVTVTEPFSAEYGMDAGAELPVKAGKIDLTLPVEEAVITNSPLVIYCTDDCKGFCPVCGANLNKSKCNCKI